MNNYQQHPCRLRLAALVMGIALASSLTSRGALAQSPAVAKPEVLTSGLSHIGLTVSDLRQTTAFFTDALGWRVAGGYPDYPSVFVTDGQIFVTLWQATNPAEAVAFDRKNNVGLHHLALSVTSLDALHEMHRRLVAAEGVVVEFGPQLNGDGPTMHMMIYEPSGNRIEFAYSP